MGLDRLLGDDEPVCDLGIRKALGDQLKDLRFARGELLESERGRRRLV
ncbi:MAG TPA: hypothetical protein VIH85_24570 [Solirubrobacteraceae bacterium]